MSVLLFLLTSFQLINAQSTTWNWTRQLNGPTNEEEIDAVASDAAGNVYISGKFEQSVEIEGVNLPLISAGLPDIMFTKYDIDGNMIWTKQYGSTGNDNVFDADCDSQGNIILSGYFEGTVTFDTITLSALGGTDMMVLKFNPNGNIIWAKQMGGSSDDGGNEVSVGVNDRIVVGAQSEGVFSAGSFSFPNTGSQDAYLISITSDGTVEWVRSVQGAGLARAKSVYIDAVGNSYLGGDFVGPNAIIAPSDSFSLNYVGLRDAYVSSWTPNGELRWYKSWGGNGVELCKGITTNDQLEVYLVGPLSQSVNFEGQQLTSLGEADLFIWKTDSLGNSLWLRQISSVENITGGEVVTGPDGGVIGGISIIGNAYFQTNGPDTIIQTGSTEKWPAFMQYNSDGSLNLVSLPDDCYTGRFGEISRSGSTVYLDIEYNGQVDFSGNIIDTDQLSNRDGAIVSLSLDDPTLSISQIADQSFNIRVYPNPTKGQVSISINKQVSALKLQVFNAIGELVQSKQITGMSEFSHQLPETPGIYFLRLYPSDWQSNIIKVIKE